MRTNKRGVPSKARSTAWLPTAPAVAVGNFGEILDAET